VNVNHEVRIGSQRIQATCCDGTSLGNSRQATLDTFFVHRSLFFRSDQPLHVIWVRGLSELLGRNFDCFALERRKAIEAELIAVPKDPDKNRKPGRRKFRAAIFPDVEPVHDLPVNREQMRV
jgi:hypothetical protein